jgi:hypothetical protein
MRIAVRNIEWEQDRRVRHGTAGYLCVGSTLRKVAMIVNENVNPLRPSHAKVPPKPYTLELYIPVPSSVDKVMKFYTEATAKAEATRQLGRFIADATEAL